MAKRMSSVRSPHDDAVDPGATTARATYRERTEEANAIAGLAALLVAMKPHQLEALALPAELAEAITVCQSLTKSARSRQLRLLGKLLRRENQDELRTAVTQVMRGKGARSQREKIYETWRERLLVGGDAALTEFAAQHRDADLQRVRQLLRLAGRDPTSVKSKHAARDLLRLIRELGEADATKTDEAMTDPSSDDA